MLDDVLSPAQTGMALKFYKLILSSSNLIYWKHTMGTASDGKSLEVTGLPKTFKQN